MSTSKAAKADVERKVILLRHGIAEDRGTGGKDELRKLTAVGRARMKENARGLERVVPDVEIIVSSPLLRAVQTAQIVAKAYGGVKIITTEVLSPGGTPKAFRELLDTLEQRRVIFVGHEPDLTALFRALAGLRRNAGRFELKKGGCYGFTVTADGVTLDFVLPPRVLRKL